MLKMLFPNGLKKTFTLSYDDGLLDDIRLMDLMDKYGIKGTFNVSSALYCEEGKDPGTRWPRLTKSQALKEYDRENVEVAVHGLAHRDFCKITEAQLYLEIAEDRANLEREYGYVVKGAAYPYGTWNERAIHALAHNGIKYCRTVQCDQSFRLPSKNEWLCLKSTCHHNVPNLMELAKTFVESDFTDCKMFYVWGHTAEFRNNDNWDVIEELLEYMAERGDIWYATNIEICEYCLAYEQLEYSVAPDVRMVYNPTAKEIWLESFGGKIISVKPGETVKY